MRRLGLHHTKGLTGAVKSTVQIHSDDLLQLTGMSPDLALKLAQSGIRTREQLAEQAVDDLADIEGLDATEAGALIMQARQIWFEAGK